MNGQSRRLRSVSLLLDPIPVHDHFQLSQSDIATSSSSSPLSRLFFDALVIVCSYLSIRDVLTFHTTHRQLYNQTIHHSKHADLWKQIYIKDASVWNGVRQTHGPHQQRHRSPFHITCDPPMGICCWYRACYCHAVKSCCNLARSVNIIRFESGIDELVQHGKDECRRHRAVADTFVQAVQIVLVIMLMICEWITNWSVCCTVLEYVIMVCGFMLNCTMDVLNNCSSVAVYIDVNLNSHLWSSSRAMYDTVNQISHHVRTLTCTTAFESFVLSVVILIIHTYTLRFSLFLYVKHASCHRLP